MILKKGDIHLLESRLEDSCRNAFHKAFGRMATDKEIKGLKKICTILQSCDSGAYTRYANVNEGNIHVSGANDRFTESFIINKRGNPRIKVFEDEGM
jgi:hypothetical protein